MEYDGPWRNLEEGEFATLGWVSWFNSQRLLAPLGYIPPDEFEKSYLQSAPEVMEQEVHTSDEPGTVHVPSSLCKCVTS
jgi:hypothetical protein